MQHSTKPTGISNPFGIGKDISSRNSTKHGGCATTTLILASESLDEYLELEAARAEWFFFRAEPTTPIWKPSYSTKLCTCSHGPANSTRPSLRQLGL